MKFNFGTGLILFFALWAMGILFLVYKSSKENIDLVSTDYYNKEAAYQSQIDKEKNVSGLSKPVAVSFDHSGDAVTIQFPNDFQLKPIAGTIHFFKPDDAAKDFDVKIETDASLRQIISAEKMSSGLWRAKISWSCGDVNYYSEENLQIKK
jgi:hypothetical protein